MRDSSLGSCIFMTAAGTDDVVCSIGRRRQVAPASASMTKSALEVSRKALQLMTSDGTFNRHLQRVKILSSGGGKLTAELLVQREDVNRRGTLHGGLTCTLVDIMSSLAFLSSRPVDESAFPGVSVDLNVSFLSPVAEGETILMTATTVRQGKTLAFLSVDIMNKNKEQLAAMGKHVLAVDPSLPPPAPLTASESA